MRSVIIYSGGLDSTVLLYKLASENALAEAVSINYGQRHAKELEFAFQNCKKLGVKFNLIDLSSLNSVFGNSALTNQSIEVPDGEYARGNIALTVVPNRNMIMLSIAAARAMALGCGGVAYAAHSGDHALYPDCTPEFAGALAKAIALADERKIELLRPFINMGKADIVKLGAELGVDFSGTWSCYKGGKLHCGKCSTCRERRQAFIEAGVPDPTEYAS
ncbi:MAG: 7-cyano-7-deazaguanine synthase QueC [Opitutales bacterium]|nr:7-cyano-7-deazaguanine synthase QueC [Opitutales bacterium]